MFCLKDNAKFLKYNSKKGFFIAVCPICQTVLTVRGSVLNSFADKLTGLPPLKKNNLLTSLKTYRFFDSQR